ncbi:MAG TPA: hypothetical protein VGR71_11650 [Nitrospira sp.]|nr:hypothetical protein [Nitrospira sp.]
MRGGRAFTGIHEIAVISEYKHTVELGAKEQRDLGLIKLRLLQDDMRGAMDVLDQYTVEFRDGAPCAVYNEPLEYATCRRC